MKTIYWLLLGLLIFIMIYLFLNNNSLKNMLSGLNILKESYENFDSISGKNLLKNCSSNNNSCKIFEKKWSDISLNGSSHYVNDDKPMIQMNNITNDTGSSNIIINNLDDNNLGKKISDSKYYILYMKLKLINTIVSDVELDNIIVKPNVKNSYNSYNKDNDYFEIFSIVQFDSDSDSDSKIIIQNNNIADSIQIIKLKLFETYNTLHYLTNDNKIEWLSKSDNKNDSSITNSEIVPEKLEIDNKILLIKFKTDNSNYLYKQDGLNNLVIDIDSNKLIIKSTEDNDNKVEIDITKNKNYLLVLKDKKIHYMNLDKDNSLTEYTGDNNDILSTINTIDLSKITNIDNVIIYSSEDDITDLIKNLKQQNNIINLNDKLISNTSNDTNSEDESNIDRDICYTDCQKSCSALIDSSISQSSINDFNNCKKNCKAVVPSCVKMCKMLEFENDPMCVSNSTCPTAYKKGKNYYIYVNKNSIYCTGSDSGDDFGEKSYGKDRDKVRKIYEINYPNCPVPSVLKPENNLDKCPFIINNNNPCYSNECVEYDWSKYDDVSNMNQQCKNTVYNYCLTNKDVDDRCICWSDVKKNDETCSKVRREFINEDDVKCDISNFKIQSHPDYYKYIQKDNIPCWNCDIPIEKPDKKSYKNFTCNNNIK